MRHYQRLWIKMGSIKKSTHKILQVVVCLVLVLDITVAVPPRFIDFPGDGITIPDTAPTGAVVATIKATDDDGDELTITNPYQNSRSVVHVQCCTITGSQGEITAANVTLNIKLDASVKTDYGLIQFKVAHGGTEISKTTKIIAEAGELPKFLGKASYSATVPLNAPVGYNITTVQATSKYPPVSYNFKEESSRYEISNAGIVTLKDVLTNATAGDMELLAVLAKDRYGAHVERKLNITVTEPVGDKTTDNSAGRIYKAFSFHMTCQLIAATLVSIWALS